MPKWEYLTLTRKRDKGLGLSWKEDVALQLPQLGESGWELIAVSPHAGIINSGATTEEVWVFKRPKN